MYIKYTLKKISVHTELTVYRSVVVQLGRGCLVFGYCVHPTEQAWKFHLQKCFWGLLDNMELATVQMDGLVE